MKNQEVQVNPGRDRFTEYGKDLKFEDELKYPVKQDRSRNIVDNRFLITLRRRLEFELPRQCIKVEEGTHTPIIKLSTVGSNFAISKQYFKTVVAKE